jgi:hypothetical protein
MRSAHINAFLEAKLLALSTYAPRMLMLYTQYIYSACPRLLYIRSAHANAFIEVSRLALAFTAYASRMLIFPT